MACALNSFRLLSMGVKTSFGENLKYYRKKKRLTQEELSEKVDISVNHLSAIERGMSFVTSELLEQFALALEIPVFFLFVDDRNIFFNEKLLADVDRIVETRLSGIDDIIEGIKSDIRGYKG
jgi:transcriptional regulator with XRE-family HTH domain